MSLHDDLTPTTATGDGDRDVTANRTGNVTRNVTVAGQGTRAGWVPTVGGADRPAVLTTPGGAWLVGADPARQLAVAAFRPGPLGSDTLTVADLPAWAAASSWDLEARLGTALPASVHDAVATRQAVLRLDRPVLGVRATVGTAAAPAADGDRAPAPTDVVHVPGRPATTYRRATVASRPLLRWEAASLEDPRLTYRLDVYPPARVAQHGADAPPAYRLSFDGRVVFAGDDLTPPPGLALRSTDTVRGLVGVLLDPEPDLARGLGPAQQAFLAARTDDLACLVADLPGPYLPGTRVEVDVPGRATTTGQVAGHVSGSDGEPRAYQWIPDDAQLPGHPWYASTRNTILSRAADVRPTLLPAPTGTHPDLPPTYGARTTYLSDEGQQLAGTVVRSELDGGRLRCTVRFDDQPGPPVRLDAADLDTTGTAWPDTDTLVAARTALAADLRPVAGELLVADDRTTVLAPAGRHDGGGGPGWTAVDLGPAAARALAAALDRPGQPPPPDRPEPGAPEPGSPHPLSEAAAPVAGLVLEPAGLAP